jgi:2-C-methyl-D-erythritol 4-phosphate cytidylyltransferase
LTGERVGAIIVAAGAGERFGGDKVFAPLGDRPVLAHAVAAFERCAPVAEIVVVLGEANVERGRALARAMGWVKTVALCTGGARRQDSVREGLKRLSTCAWTVIHDGARPLVTAEMIERGLAAARRTGAATAAVPVKDTIKVVGPDGLVVETPDRAALWQAQTPQVFRHDFLLAAYRETAPTVTDDAALLERRGIAVAVFAGAYENVKITTHEDLALAACLLRQRG